MRGAWVFASCALLWASSAATHHKKGVDAHIAACREWFAIPPTQRPHKKECEGWANTKRAAAAHDASLAPHKAAASAWVANTDSEAPQPSRVEPPVPRGWKQEYE